MLRHRIEAQDMMLVSHRWSASARPCRTRRCQPEPEDRAVTDAARDGSLHSAAPQVDQRIVAVVDRARFLADPAEPETDVPGAAKELGEDRCAVAGREDLVINELLGGLAVARPMLKRTHRWRACKGWAKAGCR